MKLEEIIKLIQNGEKIDIEGFLGNSSNFFYKISNFIF